MSGKSNDWMGGMGRAHVSPIVAGMRSEGDGPHVLHAPVLVLNASYEPINVCAARRAIVLVLKGIAMTEEENGHFLHAARVAMRLPSRIVTTRRHPRTGMTIKSHRLALDRRQPRVPNRGGLQRQSLRRAQPAEKTDRRQRATPPKFQRPARRPRQRHHNL